MDPVTLVTTALVAGGVAGISGAASSAVQGSYQALCGAVRRKLSGGEDGPEGQQERAEVLDAYLTNPVGHHEGLVRALVAAHADRDPELADAARAVLVLTHPGVQADQRTLHVDARHAQGFIAGDHARQTNHFSG
ncbi:hypothetical protein ACFYNL_35670 [Streptomyces sp. NPDC007808]|uniref:hypothetical protein n=1 Tax=Streptomyces sp. NPDC007808 TaxID=3364779 RepID=UPI0036D1D173